MKVKLLDGTTRDVHIVTHQSEGPRVREALQIAREWGYQTMVFHQDVYYNPWDITFHLIPNEYRSKAIRTASHLVMLTSWGGAPNRIGIYDNSHSLEFAIPEALLRIEKWRCSGYESTPWGGLPTGLESSCEYFNWRDEVLQGLTPVLGWVSTPHLESQLTIKQRNLGFERWVVNLKRTNPTTSVGAW